MAQLANCPQCDHELLVPEGAAIGAWARCPSCRAFFQLKDAKARDLAAVELVDSELASDHGQHHTAKTQDLASLDTWVGVEKEDKLHLDDDSDTAPLSAAPSAEASVVESEEFGFADLEAMLGDDDLAEEKPLSALSTPSATSMGSGPESNELRIADVADDEPLDLDGPTAEAPQSESLEEAAERIDAWFRSAKTVADVPPLGNSPVEAAEIETTPAKSKQPEAEVATSSAATNATIDLGSGGIDDLDLSDDFELDQSSHEPQEVAAWDDSQHMDQLLADAQDKPHDQFEPQEEDDAAAFERESDLKESAKKWSTEETVSLLTKAGKQPRKRSFVRTFATSAIAGVLGLGLGYYALLWYQGPPGDFLNWAHYMPKALLPSSFSGPSRLMVAAPVMPQKTEETPAAPTAPATPEPEPKADDAVKTAAAATEPAAAAAPAEKQANFNEPVDAQKPAADAASKDKDDRYAVAATTVNKPAEPATLDAPPAAPMKEAAKEPEPINLKYNPSFRTEDLAEAINKGKDSAIGLVEGNLTDSKEIAKKKGFSYSVLADLAQKVTFVDPTAPSTAQLQRACDNLFGEMLSTPHAREEVAQIAPKWIASASRKQGGIFFAGKIASEETKGGVSVCSVDLGNGQSLTVLLPARDGQKLKSLGEPVAIVGWLIEKPAETVASYTGTTPTVVYAGRAVPLH